jgi:hypothetical protein
LNHIKQNVLLALKKDLNGYLIIKPINSTFKVIIQRLKIMCNIEISLKNKIYMNEKNQGWKKNILKNKTIFTKK